MLACGNAAIKYSWLQNRSSKFIISFLMSNIRLQTDDNIVNNPRNIFNNILKRLFDENKFF